MQQHERAGNLDARTKELMLFAFRAGLSATQHAGRAVSDEQVEIAVKTYLGADNGTGMAGTRVAMRVALEAALLSAAGAAQPQPERKLGEHYRDAAPRVAARLRELFKRLDNLQDQATVSDAAAILLHLAEKR